MKKVAVIGIVGLPANYGGFETLVENIIGDNASSDVEYTIYCSSMGCPSRVESYKGATLKYVGLNANGAQSILYDGVSLLRSIWGYDDVVVLGVSGGIFFPLFRLFSRSRFIVNIDGIEWRRNKWNRFAKFILHLSERLAVRFADVIVADNQGIVDHVTSSYHRDSTLIAYGGDHVVRNVTKELTDLTLSKYGLESKSYVMSLCRIEPENNCDEILESFRESRLPSIFIGNWCKSEYGVNLKAKYFNVENIHILDAIYDLDTLQILRTNCRYYIHGHSAGGTNPSLVEAMYSGCNIIAYDVVYNRATTEGKAHYFKNSQELTNYLTSDLLLDISADMEEIAHRRYRWSLIARQYESLY